MRIMTRLTPRSLSVRMNGRMLGRAARNLARGQAAAAGNSQGFALVKPERGDVDQAATFGATSQHFGPGRHPGSARRPPRLSISDKKSHWPFGK
jgi:hypothetical protein